MTTMNEQKAELTGRLKLWTWKDDDVNRVLSHVCLYAMNCCLLTLIFAGIPRLSKVGSGPFTALGFVVLDLLSYFVHWLMHSVPLLYRFHKLHHNDLKLDPFTNLRNHFVQIFVFCSLQNFVAQLMGISVGTVLTYQSISFIMGFFQHSSAQPNRLSRGWLERFLVLSRFHSNHHETKSGGSHFGSVFTLWDHIFRTNLPKRAVTEETFTASNPLWKESLWGVGCASLLVLLVTGPLAHASEQKPYEELKQYGKDILTNTPLFFGPKGKVKAILKTRMTCQNCHLEAGTKSFGISLAWSHMKYPSYQGRGAKIVTLADRINNCFERPMNGEKLDLSSREMVALLVYLKDLNDRVAANELRKPERLNDMVELTDRAADPKKGGLLFEKHCVSCHGLDGQGKLNPEGAVYLYPPLWGMESYGAGSNMFRVIKLAAFIRANMPLGATSDKPTLTSAEALDLAAFINNDKSHPRPINRWVDYPQVHEKPIDFPIGPYPDNFSAEAHKYGPFLPIIKKLSENGITPYY